MQKWDFNNKNELNDYWKYVKPAVINALKNNGWGEVVKKLPNPKDMGNTGEHLNGDNLDEITLVVEKEYMDFDYPIAFWITFAYGFINDPDNKLFCEIWVDFEVVADDKFEFLVNSTLFRGHDSYEGSIVFSFGGKDGKTLLKTEKFHN